MTAPTPDDPTDQPTDPTDTVRPDTGHPGVDRTLAALDELTSRPLDDHLDLLSTVHEQLHATLDEHRGPDADEGPATATDPA